MSAAAAPSSAAPVILLDRVSLGPLRELSLAISRGERFGITGGNGTGKTTLLRLLAGLVRGAGVVRVGGRCALVAQAPGESLLPWCSVRANVELAARDAPARADAALEAVDLPRTLWDRSPAHLSGGEQQRVALARALAAAPAVLLLDEPLSAIDLPGRLALRGALLAHARACGTTVVLVSHDLDDLLSLAHRVLVLGSTPRELTVRALSRERGREAILAACRALGEVR